MNYAVEGYLKSHGKRREHIIGVYPTYEKALKVSEKMKRLYHTRVKRTTLAIR